MSEVFKGDLGKIPEKRRKQICTCPSPCQVFLTIVADTDFILCANQAREFAFDILRPLGIMSSVNTVRRPFWTTKDEDYIRHYLEEFGQHPGAYKCMAEHLGRTYHAVKTHVGDMRKAGKLPPKE